MWGDHTPESCCFPQAYSVGIMMSFGVDRGTLLLM